MMNYTNAQSVKRPLNTGQEGRKFDIEMRRFMLNVYNVMCLGLGLTAAVAFYVSTRPEFLSLLSSWWAFGVLFAAIFVLGFVAGSLFESDASLGKATFVFFLYTTVWGLFLAPLAAQVIATDPMALVRAFFITMGTFAGMSLLGYTTKVNLRPLQTFFVMAVIGLLVAMIVNLLFIQSDVFSTVLSVIVVLVFSGITAYETQNLRKMCENYPGDLNKKKAVHGALLLYGTVVVLFVHILSLVSSSE